MINLRLKSWKFKADNKAQFELTTDLNTKNSTRWQLHLRCHLVEFLVF